MKLSIIVPVYRKNKFLSKYLDRVSHFPRNNFELIFIVDTNLENVLNLIEDKVKNIKGSYKIIYNSKRSGRTNAVNLGIKEADGDYLLIHSLTNKFDANMVDILLVEAKNKNSDIIEFKPQVAEPIKFKGSLRKLYTKPVEIENRHDVVAYSYPFTYNKIFKTKVMKEAIKVPSILKTSNTRFSIEILFKMFAVSKTYSTISISPVRSYAFVEKNYNPLEIEKEWKQILSSDTYKKYTSEIEYSKYYYDLFIATAYVKATKNKVLIKKFETKFNESYKGSSLFKLNKYYLSNNNETRVMKLFLNKSSHKAFKEL